MLDEKYMEYIVIAIVLIVLIIVLKIVYGYKIKELKTIGINDELDKIAQKYPDNIEMCKTYLKMLNNESVQIEENKDTEASLYIAISNKISIANIKNSYTRIQTIAHECLHSIQDRKLLMFNFVFSNLYIIYFIVIVMLDIFRVLPYKMMFLTILVIFGFVQYSVRAYLENDAMIKARYLAKDYMENTKISSQMEINQVVAEFDKINTVGVKCVNFNLLFSILNRILLFAIVCTIW